MPFRGTHDEITRERISTALRGHACSERARARISAAKMGKPLSPEHRLAISVGKRRAAELDPEREARRRAAHGEMIRRLWSDGAYAQRKPRTSDSSASRETAATPAAPEPNLTNGGGR